MTNTIEEHEYQKDLQEQLEHRDVLLALGVLLQMKEGQQFLKYLFKHFDVACVPEIGLEGKELHEYLGFLRAGNSIYKLVCEADFEKAALLLSKLERERYDKIIEQHRFEAGFNTASDGDDS